jgi:GMP synthase-like glutamine amidotransferase
VGWQEVQFTDGQRLKVFQWHGYSFSLPPGTELLASNDACQYQAFSRGSQVLACQFHPETTREWAIECSESPKLPTSGYVQTREEIQRDLKFQPGLQAWYFSQLDRLAKSQA